MFGSQSQSGGLFGGLGAKPTQPQSTTGGLFGALSSGTGSTMQPSSGLFNQSAPTSQMGQGGLFGNQGTYKHM